MGLKSPTVSKLIRILRAKEKEVMNQRYSKIDIRVRTDYYSPHYNFVQHISTVLIQLSLILFGISLHTIIESSE